MSLASPLPRYATAFVGRQAQVDQVSEAVGAPGIVTLHGPPGVGKTRTAIEVGRRAARDRMVVFCDVSDARGPDDVVAAVIAAVGLQGGGTDLAGEVAGWMGGIGVVLCVLDNFERVAHSAAALLARWVDEAPGATLLVTSRHRLGLASERVMVVEPLPVPDDDADAGALELNPAVALFRSRVDPATWARLGERGALARLARVVRDLEGLPLALELGAARLEVLGIDELHDRLQARFAVLRDPSSEGGRHGTLHTAIDWSWGLLDRWEGRALAQASVFVGGFDASAAAEVLEVGAPDGVDAKGVLDSLVDKSLLRRDGDRYGFLDSVHAFAASRLDPAERRAVQARHRRWYAHGARAATDLRKPSRDTLLRELARNRANLAAALDHALESDAVDDAVALTVALGELVQQLGPAAMPLARVDAVLDAVSERVSPDHRAALLQRRAAMQWYARRYDDAETTLRQALSTGSDPALDGYLLVDLAELLSYMTPDRRSESRELLERALAVGRDQHLPALEGHALAVLGKEVELTAGDQEHAEAHLRLACARFEQVGDLTNLGIARSYLAHLLARSGRAAESLTEARAALAVHERVANRHHIHATRSLVGDGMYLAGDPDGAREAWGRSQQEALALGDAYWVAANGIALAAVDALQERYADAERRLGACGEAVHREGSPRQLSLFHGIGAALAAVRGDDPEPELAACDRVVEAHGRLLGVCEAAAHLVALYRGESAVRTGDREAAAGAVSGARAWLQEQRLLGVPIDVLFDWVAQRVGRAGRGAEGWLIESRGQWFEAPDGTRIDVSAPSSREILALLLRHRLEDPGEPVPMEALARAGWPGERLVPEAAANRVYVATSALRRAGLAALEQAYGRGWFLSAAVEVVPVGG